MVDGVAVGGPQVGVAEAVRDAVDGHAAFEQGSGPVGAQGARVREPFGHAVGQRAGAHELVDWPENGSGGWAPGKRPRQTNTGCSSRSPRPRGQRCTLSQASSAVWVASGI